MSKSKAYSGRYRLLNPQKYLGKYPNDIIWRSTWERKVFKWLDMNPSVLGWVSEEIPVIYTSPIDGKKHRYFPDVFMIMKNKNGEIKKYLVEIKPFKETVPPKLNGTRKSKKLLTEAVTFAINQAKWKAAQELCEKNGIQFMILTENEIFGKRKRKQ